MNKVILFYKFVPLPDPQMAMLWQKELCANLGLKGRIIVSPHGINGTLGGNIENLRKYKRAMNASGRFRAIQYKWSDGDGREFSRLSVKVRDELVSFKKTDEVKVNEQGVVGGGKHLKPEAVHKLVKERGDEVIFFDGRNAYEAQVGRFKDAIVPDTKTTRDFVSEIESGKYDDIKDKPVVTYCTGGIRCEVLSVLMKNRGFKEVYQMDGGIVKYGEKYGDDGLWEGNLYIFDGRMNHKFSDKSKDIGECVHCAGKTSNFENCADKSCNRLVLICESCKDGQKIFCENHSLAEIK
ncbi:MAG TPA: rhodanese-related sulfurtransferase [Candidatus Saccharimonadales bacterium]|nr:rhodanese-related sulfurtransferase [Candidatus Saccharimonadales bacterium]